MHQLAFLTPKRAVAWKCLSLLGSESRDGGRFAPVAYASRSGSFFAGLEGQTSPGVLWVISEPVYRQRGAVEAAFPPTLTARLVVDRVVRGEEIWGWGDSLERDLRIPEGDDEFEHWRTAASITDPIAGAIFRITRSFALLAWAELRGAGRRQVEAWARVRTAVANREASQFLAHVDADTCLRSAFGLPAGRKVGTWLESPRQVRSAATIDELAELARIGTNHSVFMNYRWNARAADVVALARELLALRCAVWLDGLTIPHFVDNPVCWTPGKRRRRDPRRGELEELLNLGIDDSALFLCLAADDYLNPPQDEPAQTKNWAVREYDHARARAEAKGRPQIRVVDLGRAPDAIRNENPGRVLDFGRDVKPLARSIAALVRQA